MKRLKKAFTRKSSEKPSRITNETVAEHREKVLAGGRRFKYPVQYTKSRLIVNAIIIAIVALIVAVVFVWWQLYRSQNTSDFFYKLTQVVPLPVASADGEIVRYDDYLVKYRASETYLTSIEQANSNLSDEDRKRQLNTLKTQAMDGAIEEAYARKLAKELNISVTDADVDDIITTLRRTSSSQGEISEDAYHRSAEQLYGLSASENRDLIRDALMKRRVAFALDDAARQDADKVAAYLKENKDTAFADAAEKLKEQGVEVEVFASGTVSTTNVDGGLAATAASLEKGQISDRIESTNGDGYYFVQSLGLNKDGKVSYYAIKVPITEFRKRLDAIKAEGKVQKYIDITETVTN